MSLFGGLKKLVSPVLKGVGGVMGGPLGTAIGGAIGGLVAGTGNKKTADNYAQQAQWQNTPITMPGLGLSYGPNGQPIGSITDPTNQNFMHSMMNQGQGMMGDIGNQYGMMNQGMNNLPGMGGVYGQTNQFLGNNNAILGQLQMAGMPLGGSQFMGQANQALGALGSFNPQDAANAYTGNLNQMAAQGEKSAAEQMTQNLYNTGRLGTTGGAEQMGQLTQAQNQAALGRQVAGMQYGQQQQQGLAGMAQGLAGTQAGLAGQLSGILGQQAGIDSNALGMMQNVQGQGYNQANNTTNQRFQNAMQMFGGGMGASQLGNQVGQQDQQNLLQMMGLSGSMSGARAGTNAQAYMPQMQAGVGFNNAIGSGITGMLGAMFPQQGQPQQNYNPNTPMYNQTFPNGVGIQGLGNPFAMGTPPYVGPR